MGWLILLLPVLIATVQHVHRRASAQKKLSAIIAKYALFRAGLSVEAKERYDDIALRSVNDMEWVGSDMEVVDEMKAMIGACAAQLLWNLPDVSLDHFTRVVIHRGHFRSARTAQLHVGETHPLAGDIVISWRDLVFGYAHSHDAENVGLHELAHALWFENLFLGNRSAVWTDELVTRWKSLAEEEISAIRAGRSKLLSRYAGTNQAEFFAVAVEFFFERSQDFREKLPELYGTMMGLLRQDPATTQADGARHWSTNA